MPCQLTKKWKCKQRVCVKGKARNKHDKIKLMTYIEYIQQSWTKEKEKNKKLMCINHTTNAPQCYVSRTLPVLLDNRDTSTKCRGETHKAHPVASSVML